MDEIDKKDRAVRAERLLADDLLSEALREIENAAIEALAAADVSDHAALQCATANLQAARRFKSRLESMVKDQKFAERPRLATA